MQPIPVFPVKGDLNPLQMELCSSLCSLTLVFSVGTTEWHLVTSYPHPPSNQLLMHIGKISPGLCISCSWPSGYSQQPNSPAYPGPSKPHSKGHWGFCPQPQTPLQFSCYYHVTSESEFVLCTFASSMQSSGIVYFDTTCLLWFLSE